MTEQAKRTRKPADHVTEVVERLKKMNPDALNAVGERLAKEAKMSAGIVARALAGTETRGA